MYYLQKNKSGFHKLNKTGRQLINQFYKPPNQHGKKHIQQWINHLYRD